jgi:hypothetical protein
MPIRINPFFNNPAFAQAASNLAALFAPPSGEDEANYASAQAKREAASRLALQYAHSQDPSFNRDLLDRGNVTVGTYSPVQSYYAQDQNIATTQRGQDLTARTSVSNNAADNTRALETNGQDNLTKIILSGNQPLNPGQRLPGISADVLHGYGYGNVPAVPAAEGAPKPPTEDEVKAAILGTLPVEQQQAVAFGSTPVENVIGANNKPVIATRLASIGQQPAPAAPTTVINNGPNGVDYGKPDDGTVWARNPDNTVKLDERGAPIAIPYQGGKVWAAQQAAATAAANKSGSETVQNNIVLQDIDRALTGIDSNPTMTTGLGSQLTSGIGGSPARNVNSLLDTVRANVGFKQLQSMRDASPTGGALGQVTERETALLQAVLGSLETTQDPTQLTDNLKRLKNTYLDIIHGPGNGPPREMLSFEKRGPAQRPSAPNGPAVGAIEDGFRFKGGNPGDPSCWEQVR